MAFNKNNSSGKTKLNYGKVALDIFQDKDGNRWTLDDLRADIVKHPDNLKLEGTFTEKPVHVWRPGERAPIVKRKDSLKLGGVFYDHPPKIWLQGERVINCNNPFLLHIFLF